MLTLSLWLAIFVFGLALYFMPVFFVYEGFDEAAYLKKLNKLLETQVAGTPELSVEREDKDEETQSPDGADTTSSRPGKAADVQPDNTVLDQGKAFQKARPARERACPTCPTCPTCPPVKQCPDMSAYIKKDSIPCWACKLG